MEICSELLVIKESKIEMSSIRVAKLEGIIIANVDDVLRKLEVTCCNLYSGK